MFTIPDKGEGANDLQSILFQEYLEVLVAAIDGADCVLSGCEVTAQGAPDMTVAVAKGAVLSNKALFAVAAGNVTITAADGTNPRLDLIVITSAGAKAARTGTAAASPKPPTRTANDVVIAVVYVPAADTTIATNQITDLRVLRTVGPLCIQRNNTAVTFNTSTALNTFFTITLPSGLFLAGRALRIRCGGTYLLNSGTPTLRIVMAYGGTTMFDDTSGAATADADRGAWTADIVLHATGNATQILNGDIHISTLTAKTVPTTGTGDIAVATYVLGPFKGAASVNSDTGDRTFTLQFAMNVSNVNNEIVMDYAHAELV